MRLNELIHGIILEDYKTAAAEFNQSADPAEVEKTIAQYRELVNKNQVQGNERNIDWWAKQGWDQFSQFVAKQAAVPTRTKVKRKMVVGSSITLRETDDWLIVIPLDSNASCFHGRDTDWCVSKPDHDHFEKYFYHNNITLIFCLNKRTGGRWAIAQYPDGRAEYFDQEDKELKARSFQRQTRLDPNELMDMARARNQDIEPEKLRGRELQAQALAAFKEWRASNTYARDPQLEELLLSTKRWEQLSEYVAVVGKMEGPQKYTGPLGNQITRFVLLKEPTLIRYLADITPEQQMMAVKKYGRSIKFLKNPSEEVQLAAVQQNAGALEHIEHPSTKVQIAAIQTDPWIAWSHIKNPSEEVQMAAVRKSGYVLTLIKDPSPQVQLAAIQQNGHMIERIKDPSPELQMIAVKQTGTAIKAIKNPSPELQLAAVNQDWLAIRHIKDPTPEAQMAAVKKEPSAYMFLKNPAPEVIAYKKSIRN